jgi:hypothetical protein
VAFCSTEKWNKTSILGSFQMSRKKTAREHIRDGDPQRKGVHTLDRMAEAEPKVEAGLPETSPRLAGEAEAAYEFLAQQLVLSGISAQADVYAVERAAQNLALMWRADRALQREGPVRRIPVMTGRGGARHRIGFRQVRNKWLQVRIDAEKSFARFASPLGICGAHSRAGLQVDHSASADAELWQILNQPRKPRVPNPEELATHGEPKSEEPIQ